MFTHRRKMAREAARSVLPSTRASPGASEIAFNLWDRLTRLDGRGALHPMIALSWKG